MAVEIVYREYNYDYPLCFRHAVQLAIEGNHIEATIKEGDGFPCPKCVEEAIHTEHQKQVWGDSAIAKRVGG